MKLVEVRASWSVYQGYHKKVLWNDEHHFNSWGQVYKSFIIPVLIYSNPSMIHTCVTLDVFKQTHFKKSDLDQ